MNSESEMEAVVKKSALIVGIVFLAISVYFSYDGFDQEVTGGNGGYTGAARIIGICLAVGASVIQFILSSRPDQLNLTLKVAGLATYAYSIRTNYLGIVHTLEMPSEMAVATAFFLDVLAEPMISWGLGDAMKGDLLGNAFTWVGAWFKGTGGKQKQQQHGQQHQQKPIPKQQTRPMFHQDDDDEREEPDTQPRFRAQREASFSGPKKPNGGFQDRRVREDLRGKIGKR